ncbi:hypothetical protein FG386_002327 [Cryptosporidium ryanae]|uniref:uncharacterized protein n=1 Tax=Cryptosporidium ryanae TaxID=515981 RepID=UPI00351A93CA|nr:hypothetical protein FG386_002327 [Cryptosporidium ryanae]
MKTNETASNFQDNKEQKHNKLLKFGVIVLIVNIILGNLSKIECLYREARDDYNDDDYKISFFRKTGKYPSTDYYESNGRYGTPLVLKTNDFTLWIILFCVCFSALVIGMGTIIIVYVKNDSTKEDDDRDYVYDSEPSLLDEYYGENSKVDSIKHLRYLQSEAVKSINYSNPNINYF